MTRPAGETSQRTSAAKMVSDEGKEFLQEAAKCGLMEVRLSQIALERASNPQVRQYAQNLIVAHQRANAELAALANQKRVMVPLDTASASMRMNDQTSSGSTTGSSTSSTRSATSSGSTSSAATSGTTGTAMAPSAGTSTTDSSRTETGAAERQHGPRVASTGARLDEDSQEILDDVDKAAAKLSRETGTDFDREYVSQMIKGHERAIDLFEDKAEDTEDAEIEQFAQSKLPVLREHLTRAKALESELKG